jgi:heterodisulfide reductase subunit A-like polyferredoxin/coenzyme F420-reducing hydrogenase delta subunit
MEKVVPKIGIFVRDPGGRMAASLDLPGMLKRLGKAKNVTRVCLLADLGGNASLSSVAEGIRNGEYDRVLWVGRFNTEQQKAVEGYLEGFGLNKYLHMWCDIEEQGALNQKVASEVREKKALRLIQMALARTRLLEPLAPLEIPAVDAAMVVGGGIAGLQTALSLVELGKKVHLVEKESGVGGKVAALHRFYPRLCDPLCGLQFVVDRLRASDRIHFHTLSQVVSIDGGPGRFQVRISRRPRFVDLQRCNACGECVEACPVEIPRTQEYGAFGSWAPLEGAPRKAIGPACPMSFPTAFVVQREHCAPGCKECEIACPAGAVNLEETATHEDVEVGAIFVTTGWDPYPLSRVEEFGYGLYPRVLSNLEMERLLGGDLPPLDEVGFIQCVGSRDERHLHYCSTVCCSATLKQIRFLKDRMPHVRCYVFYQDIRSPGFQEELYQEVKALEGVIFVRGTPSTVRPDGDSGRLRVRAEDTLSGKEIRLALDLLVLAGGMVPSRGTEELAQVLNLPRNRWGFFEAHLQCHPEESQRTGIYVGGCSREPMNVSQSIDSAHRAAMEGLAFLSGTVLVSPTYPLVDKTKCDKCKRCMEECPFAAFHFDREGFPEPDLAKCRQCGNCVGICPLAAVSLRHMTIKQIAAQVQEAAASFLPEGEPQVLAFLCQNDAYHAARAAVEQGLPVPPNVIFVKVPCAGYVNNALIADALAFGIDGVLIAGCQDGQCHYVTGNQLVRKRSDDLSDKLQKMMIERDRVRFVNLEIRDSVGYVELTRSFVEKLMAMGPNPFKL